MKSYWNNLTLFGKVKFVLMLCLSIVVLVFIFQNLERITITFFTLQFEVPLSMLLLLIALFGYLFARVTDIASFSKKNKEIKKLQKDIETLKEKEIKNN